MRTPEQIVEKYAHTIYSIKDIGKIAQTEAYNKAIDDAAENAKTKRVMYFDLNAEEQASCEEIWNEGCRVPSEGVIVDKESILKLKK